MADCRYACPALGCNSVFHTVKFLCDHMMLYHEAPKNASPFTCNINSCRFKSVSVEGYRKHIVRSHPDCWNSQRLRRTEDAKKLMLDTSVVHVIQPEIAPTASSDYFCHVDTNDNLESSVTSYYNQLQKTLTQVILKHREMSLIPKSTMESLLKDIQQVMQLSHLAFAQSFLEVMTNGTIDPNSVENIVGDLVDKNEAMIDDLFQTVRSAKQLRSYCCKHLKMVQPRAECLEPVFRNGKWFKQSYQYVPIMETLKQFLSHDDVAASLVEDCRPALSNILRSYKDGFAFKNSSMFSTNSTTLRLHMYIDDFEVCNPIGSRRSIHKLTAVYFLLGNIHTRHWSQRPSVHLALLVRTQLVKKHTLEKIMKPLITDIQWLETEGLKVNFCGADTIFKGTVATISGDNLAIHEIGGFRQCFSSGKMCRHCLIDSKNLHKYVSEEKSVLRTAEVHAGHLASIKKDKTQIKTYGVKGDSVFNSLKFFSVTQCLPPDIMHDVLEGLCPINIRIVLQSLIQNTGLTIKVVNERLDSFVYSKHDVLTKPVHLQDDFMSTGKIVGSASQNWCFFRNLPFLIGDFIEVNQNTGECYDYWQLHLLCREICKVIFSPQIQEEWLLELQQYIMEHHTLLNSFNPELFTPKLHFLIHYPRLIEVYGPLRHLWCMRFEAAHQYYKKMAKISNNFKNIAKTLAERFQFKQCFTFSSDNALGAEISCVGKQVHLKVGSLPLNLQKLLCKTFSIQPCDTVLSVNSVKLNCAMLCKGELYVAYMDDEGTPIFVCITHILEHIGTWVACGLLTVAETYNKLTDSYIVKCTNDYVALSPNELLSFANVAQIQLMGDKHAVISERIVRHEDWV